MTDANCSDEDLKATMKHMREQLEVERIEKEKLQTRLKGYETVGKLATETQKENKELKKQVEELQRENDALRINKGNEQRHPCDESSIVHESGRTSIVHEPGGTSDEKDTNIPFSVQGLTDMQKTTSIGSRGHSSSFIILGKSPSQSPGPIHYNSMPSNSSTNGKNHQEECNQQSLSAVKQQSNTNQEYEKAKNSTQTTGQHSASFSNRQKQSNHNTLDEYIQVFPENSQSEGSNFCIPSSFESQVGGGQSCTNSSRRGPMSMVGVANGSMPSYHYVQVKETGKDLVQDKTCDNTTHDALPEDPNSSKQPHYYTGIGARPKGVTGPKKKYANGEEYEFSNIEFPTSATEGARTNLMVKIPCENSNSYRINNAPMLPFGRQESQTEISALTSFGSSLASVSPEKEAQEHHKFNNLNMAGQKSHSNVQLSTSKVATQEEFVMIEETPPFIPPTNPIIPAIKPISKETEGKDSNDLLIKELEVLRRKTSQLHLANKEWKDRWDVLRKQNEDENLALQAEVKQLTQEKDRNRREMEYRIMSQQEELNNMNHLKKEAEKSYLMLYTGRNQEKQLLEKLKQDYGTLHHEKRALEIQLELLQANKFVEEQKPAEVTKKSSELETELAVVKRQVTLFMDDFNKEHQERLALEQKLKKEKETTQSLETKLRKAHTLLKSRDEDLRQKSKQAADLQFQVEDLKLKLEIEKRKASIYPSMDFSSRNSFEGANNPSAQTQNINVHVPKPQKWSCPACTYVNKISHKKCEICGTPYTTTEGRYIELD